MHLLSTIGYFACIDNVDLLDCLVQVIMETACILAWLIGSFFTTAEFLCTPWPGLILLPPTAIHHKHSGGEILMAVIGKAYNSCTAVGKFVL